MTMAAAACGLSGAALMASGSPRIGLLAFLTGRLLDGLDGAIARHSRPTDRGAYLDIVLDFMVYAAVPLAFAYADPGANALAAATLLASFIANAVAFLAFALLSERRQRVAPDHSDANKSFHFLAGLAEGTETIVAVVMFCLFPILFPPLAFAFAALCAVSAVARTVEAWRRLSQPPSP
jgi:phosphatidylglycerophosphate synthase